MKIENVDELLAQYRASAHGTSDSNPSIANKSQRQMHACYRQLRDSADGKLGIALLMGDSSPHVRVWAASHTLQWNPIEATRALELLRDSRGPCSFDAEMTLRQFNIGLLSFDY